MIFLNFSSHKCARPLTGSDVYDCQWNPFSVNNIEHMHTGCQEFAAGTRRRERRRRRRRNKWSHLHVCAKNEREIVCAHNPLLTTSLPAFYPNTSQVTSIINEANAFLEQASGVDEFLASPRGERKNNKINFFLLTFIICRLQQWVRNAELHGFPRVAVRVQNRHFLQLGNPFKKYVYILFFPVFSIVLFSSQLSPSFQYSLRFDSTPGGYDSNNNYLEQTWLTKWAFPQFQTIGARDDKLCINLHYTCLK